MCCINKACPSIHFKCVAFECIILAFCLPHLTKILPFRLLIILVARSFGDEVTKPEHSIQNIFGIILYP